MGNITEPGTPVITSNMKPWMMVVIAIVVPTIFITMILLAFKGGDPLFGLAGKLVCPGTCESCVGPIDTDTSYETPIFTCNTTKPLDDKKEARANGFYVLLVTSTVVLLFVGFFVGIIAVILKIKKRRTRASRL